MQFCLNFFCEQAREGSYQAEVEAERFHVEELVALMTACGYELKKIGGSGRKFVHIATGTVMYMHQPHPSNMLKAYQVREAIDELTEKGLL